MGGRLSEMSVSHENNSFSWVRYAGGHNGGYVVAQRWVNNIGAWYRSRL
jgi:deferrochelatase/peroxidase EfeB